MKITLVLGFIVTFIQGSWNYDAIEVQDSDELGHLRGYRKKRLATEDAGIEESTATKISGKQEEKLESQREKALAEREEQKEIRNDRYEQFLCAIRSLNKILCKFHTYVEQVVNDVPLPLDPIKGYPIDKLLTGMDALNVNRAKAHASLYLSFFNEHRQDHYVSKILHGLPEDGQLYLAESLAAQKELFEMYQRQDIPALKSFAKQVKNEEIPIKKRKSKKKSGSVGTSRKIVQLLDILRNRKLWSFKRSTLNHLNWLGALFTEKDGKFFPINHFVIKESGDDAYVMPWLELQSGC